MSYGPGAESELGKALDRYWADRNNTLFIEALREAGHRPYVIAREYYYGQSYPLEYRVEVFCEDCEGEEEGWWIFKKRRPLSPDRVCPGAMRT